MNWLPGTSLPTKHLHSNLKDIKVRLLPEGLGGIATNEFWCQNTLFY